MRTILLELCPEHFQIKKWTQCYLIFEAILGIYLLICLVQIAHEKSKDHNSPYVEYRNAVAIFVFVTIMPFMASRIIALLCCKSVVSSF